MFEDHGRGYRAGDGGSHYELSPARNTSVLLEQLEGHLLDHRAKRCFLAVVHRGGFTLAAQSLGISLHRLRTEIRLLEKQLGISLFNWDGSRVILTDAGNQLYQLYQHNEQHEGVSASSIYGVHNELTLSIPTMVLEGFLFRELISVIRENAGLKVSLVNDAPELQQSADLVVWLQDPYASNELRSQLTASRSLSTLGFSPYITERRIRGRMMPVSLADLDDYMVVQYQGYERFPSFAQWNDCVIQRQHGTIHVDTPDAQWRMIRWANGVGLLPDKAVYLDAGVRRLPILLDNKLALEVWVGRSKRSANDPDARMIAERITRVLKRK
ncbi:hypothetical protein CNQ84_13675 [Pseudomonas abyssi]|jgi:DNA-binding transcriptional LysR family regulator|uniref:HTH lysR-type domain-containing protein n=1 Tax=Pseudomonas abyssi TaxID=170540 RepID=A0A2A3MFS1_9PSED|nr:LysR family transcriptional regulator [Pseudomonas abyssi]PBK03622.1 hypothetical protein CNQ84_13675 [Pseudomonas abyssi]